MDVAARESRAVVFEDHRRRPERPEEASLAAARRARRAEGTELAHLACRRGRRVPRRVLAPRARSGPRQASPGARAGRARTRARPHFECSKEPRSSRERRDRDQLSVPARTVGRGSNVGKDGQGRFPSHPRAPFAGSAGPRRAGHSGPVTPALTVSAPRRASSRGWSIWACWGVFESRAACRPRGGSRFQTAARASRASRSEVQCFTIRRRHVRPQSSFGRG